jgi:hypothetical protein
MQRIGGIVFNYIFVFCNRFFWETTHFDDFPLKINNKALGKILHDE